MKGDPSLVHLTGGGGEDLEGYTANVQCPSSRNSNVPFLISYWSGSSADLIKLLAANQGPEMGDALYCRAGWHAQGR